MAREDRSYGIIPLKRDGNSWQVLLVKHLTGFWSFPKGHKEKKESHWLAAVRELREETGLAVEKKLFVTALEERYMFYRDGEEIDKRVLYFIAEVSGEPTAQPEEIEDVRFFSFDAAARMISYEAARKILHETRLLLAKL